MCEVGPSESPGFLLSKLIADIGDTFSDITLHTQLIWNNSQSTFYYNYKGQKKFTHVFETFKWNKVHQNKLSGIKQIN